MNETQAKIYDEMKAKAATLKIEELQKSVKTLANDADSDVPTVVLDVMLAVLLERMEEKAYIEFCDKLFD